MSALNFDDATVLVTGASRGLGLALIKTLSSKAINCVYAGCKSQEGVDSIKSLALPKVVPILLDVTNAQHIANLSDVVSKLDIIINNAGIASACGYTSENALSIATAEMNVHYFGPLALIQKLLPLLKNSDNAGIINIASIAGFSNFKGMGTYSASKAALHFMTQGLRAELSEFKIFVQGVYPGPFDTRLAAGYGGPKKSPETIANSVLELFADHVDQVFPDEFSQSMHQTFLTSPAKLTEIFSQ